MSLLTPENNSVNRSRSSIEEDEEDLSFGSRASTCERLSRFKTHITCEPMMFFHMVGMTCASVMLQNMYIDRICRIREGFNDTLCTNLTNPDFEEYESIVNKAAANYGMYRGAIEAGFPVLFSLFVGPWTDKHGTKPTMLFPILGYVLQGGMYIMFSFLPDVHPHYFLICSVPVALSGGMVSLVLSVFSFIAKLTTVENRSFRIAVLEISWFLGGPVGLTLGTAIFKQFGYPGVFITSTSMYLVSFLYGFLFVKEEKPVLLEESDKNILQEMFNIESVKDMFATIFRSRNDSMRSFILLIIFALCLRIFVWVGPTSVTFLFVRQQFGWGYQEYTTFSTMDGLIQLSGGWIMVFLTMKMFKVGDTVIGIFSSIGYCLAALLLAFATKGWMMYLGAVIQMFCGLLTIVLRSMLSKCVGKEELAKVYTFVACGEASMPLLAGAIYSLVFRLTVDTFTGAIYFISVGINAIILLLFIYFHFASRKTVRHAPLVDLSSDA